ncbi:SIS domain-containing protein [Actinotignum sp. UMB0459]|uniref:SIS domain-containing protein n=1 Tax=Actinotignum sp. UMB0459 TaxID=3449314 RepID=UPI003F75763D
MKAARSAETTLAELGHVFEEFDWSQVPSVLAALKVANRVIVAGVGREGLAIRSFGMRLMHLGLNCNWVWDDSAPNLGPGDLVVMVNGSGQISHLLEVLRLAAGSGATTICLSGTAEVTDASKIADQTVFLPAATYLAQGKSVHSHQPMGTLFETALWVLFDSMVQQLHDELGVGYEEMASRHRNYE